jgi:CheY-like chemotaxis protein
MLKVFVLEDNFERIEWFSEEFKDCEFTVAINAEKAGYYIRNHKYDAIFLDHDLGGRVFVDSSDPDTGYAVAKIIASSVNKDTPVVIHSYNPAGAANIQSVLPKTSVIKPFGTFKRSILNG